MASRSFDERILLENEIFVLRSPGVFDEAPNLGIAQPGSVHQSVATEEETALLHGALDQREVPVDFVDSRMTHFSTERIQSGEEVMHSEDGGRQFALGRPEDGVGERVVRCRPLI